MHKLCKETASLLPKQDEIENLTEQLSSTQAQLQQLNQDATASGRPLQSFGKKLY